MPGTIWKGGENASGSWVALEMTIDMRAIQLEQKHNERPHPRNGVAGSATKRLPFKHLLLLMRGTLISQRRLTH